MKKEYTQEAAEQYEKLIKEIQTRRHALRNQISAAVKADLSISENADYLEALRLENRYTDLLFCGDEIIAGLFFQKCSEATENKIAADFHIYARLERGNFTQTDVAGMIGVLFDNAIEAERTLPPNERKLEFWLENDGKDSVFRIRNRFPHASYGQMENFFKEGETTKGSGHGLGLFYVRQLCEQKGGEIGCRNVETTQGNEIEFLLKLGHVEKISERKQKEHPGESRRRKLHHRSMLCLILSVIAAGILVCLYFQRANFGQNAETLDKSESLRENPSALYLDRNEYKKEEKDLKFCFFSEPEADFFQHRDARLVAIEYTYLDEDQRPVQREHFVRYGQDIVADSTILQDISSANKSPFYRQMTEYWEYDAEENISDYKQYLQYAEDEEPHLIQQPETMAEPESKLPQKPDHTYEKNGELYYAYYAMRDSDGRIVSAFDYEENPDKDFGRTRYFYKMYTIGENGQRDFHGYYYAADNLFFQDGYEYEPCVHNNRNNLFCAYAYDEHGRYRYILELMPFEDSGRLFYYVYDDINHMYTKYEYLILEISGDVFTCDFPDGSRVLAVGTYEDIVTYEYGGSRHMSVVSNISEIYCRDSAGNMICRYLFSEGYPVKTILPDGTEIHWEN